MEFPLGTKNHQRKAVDKFVARKKNTHLDTIDFNKMVINFLIFFFPFLDKILFHKRMGVTKGSEVVSQNQSPFK